MSGGWGTGWALTPWGGFLLPGSVGPTPPSPPDGFNIFCYFDEAESMGSILIDPDVSTEDAGGQFTIVSGSDLRVASGGTPPPTDNALLTVVDPVPFTWTLQAIVEFQSLPNDFSDLVHCHVYFGAADTSGLSAGLFISKSGIAYSGAVALDGGGNLTLGGPFQVIPGTAGLVEGVSYTFRIAADGQTSSVYIFATPTANVPLIGHQLVAVVPGIATGGFVTDRATISARGTDTRPVVADFDQFCLGTGLVMPNIPPRADAGRDQALRLCSVGMLDGSASFDPEGGTLTYSWRLIDAPPSSSFSFEGADGFTEPAVTPTGFTNLFYSAELGNADLDDPFQEGDVLLVGGVAYSIVTTGVDGTGYYAEITDDQLADNLLNAPYKVLRQRAISNPTSVRPTFLPDLPGIYKFDLVVFDGQYLSQPSTVIANVLESQLPKGCVPDLGFIWQYLSDFWKLVEDRERIQVFWEGMAQVVASELLTLWQVDYSKSLRDVQRSFQRRWLHYDLKLPEPLPNLTRVRRAYGGVSTSLIAAGGVSGVQGTVLEISSPAHRTFQIAFSLANPYTATKLQGILQVKLQGLDSRYNVTVLTQAGGSQRVRITAPFYFTVGENTTLPLLAAGAANTPADGTAGMRLAARTYRVDFSLQGLDIVEGDLIVIGGEGYRISRIVDDAADTHRFQRVIVQSDLPLLPGAEWEISSFVTSRLLNFYAGLLVAGDVVVFEVSDSDTGTLTLQAAPATGACVAEVGKLGVDLSLLDPVLSSPTVTTQLAYVLRRTRLPIGELVTDIPGLQEFIKVSDDGEVLRRNVDYFLEEFRGTNSLRFSAGNVGDAGDVWEGGLPPERLWAETTYLDNRPTIEANFGIPAEFTLDQYAELDTDLDYLSAVRGLWYSYLNGPTMFNLRVGAQILLGLPYAEEAGVIEEIRMDFSPTQGRLLVRDAVNTAVVRSYTFPTVLELETNPDTGVSYVVGDSVAQFAPLVQGAEILDYVKDPTWFQGILNQGVFFEVEKFHKFMMRVDSAAFSLSSLLFVRSFILRVKPTYTFPLFVVRVRVGDTDAGGTEVDVTDEMVISGKLILNDGACFPNMGVAQIFDDYRAAGGGVRNQFDSNNNNPNDAAPTFPTADSPVTWGYDKIYLCPEDDVMIYWCIDHAGGVVPYDAGFTFDDTNAPSHHFTETGITSVAASPTGLSFPGSTTVGVTGTITSVRVVVSGTLGPDPGDYELVIEVNGSDAETIPVTIAPSGLIALLVATTAVTAADTVTLRVQPASGGARAPVWSYFAVTLMQDEIPFAFDDGIAAGTYCFSRTG